ncbi:3'-5' exonuclease [Dactylosporangium darangshiense]|uniref:3'-5' exonuclease n=1 Tax=Dactylosporangium darangshiense TaxID=579108 RepID=A0ABP8D669_9ACTN
MGELLNVIDVEATCWAGQPPAGQVNEIIEIGVCVVDLEARERVARDRIMVRPARSAVSAFCTELTGITPEEAAGGVPFAEACELLLRRHRSDSRPWASWGDYDRKQFERQCNGPQRYPFGSVHVNAKAVFADAQGARRQGMAGALRTAGLPLEGRHHNGADDAWNIGALVLYLVERRQWSYGV